MDGGEHAESRDGGKTWDMYNRFPYSFEAYLRNAKRPAWIEAGLVTAKGTVVVFVTHFILGGSRTMSGSGFLRSYDQGASWTHYESVDGTHIGYPVGTAVDGDTNYVIYDSDGGGPHVLYVSTDDGRSWQKRSTLSLQDDVWYGAVTLMEDGGLLAGAYHSDDEYNFYYCISKDQGRTWTEERKARGSTRRFGIRNWATSGAGTISMGGPESYGEGSDRFVLYQSSDGENWGNAIVVSSNTGRGDGYSANCLIHTDDDGSPRRVDGPLQHPIQESRRQRVRLLHQARQQGELTPERAVSDQGRKRRDQHRQRANHQRVHISGARFPGAVPDSGSSSSSVLHLASAIASGSGFIPGRLDRILAAPGGRSPD